MAQRVMVLLSDDLDGKDIAEGKGGTVLFGLDGSNYEIDLSEKNATELREAFAKYVGSARKVGRATLTSVPTGTRGPGRPRGAGVRTAGGGVPAVAREHAQAAREWAKANGISVAERGRVPADVIEQYNARDTTPAPSSPVPAPEPAKVEEPPAAVFEEATPAKRAPRKAAAKATAGKE